MERQTRGPSPDPPRGWLNMEQPEEEPLKEFRFVTSGTIRLALDLPLDLIGRGHGRSSRYAGLGRSHSEGSLDCSSARPRHRNGETALPPLHKDDSASPSPSASNCTNELLPACYRTPASGGRRSSDRGHSLPVRAATSMELRPGTEEGSPFARIAYSGAVGRQGNRDGASGWRVGGVGWQALGPGLEAPEGACGTSRSPTRRRKGYGAWYLATDKWDPVWSGEADKVLAGTNGNRARFGKEGSTPLRLIGRKMDDGDRRPGEDSGDGGVKKGYEERVQQQLLSIYSAKVYKEYLKQTHQRLPHYLERVPDLRPTNRSPRLSGRQGGGRKISGRPGRGQAGAKRVSAAPAPRMSAITSTSSSAERLG